MAAGGVRVEGLSKKVRQLKLLGLEVEDLKDAFAAIAAAGSEAVLRFTPQGETGKLRDSIRGNRAQSKAVVRAGRAAVPYAGAINYGWAARGIEPAQYMQKGDQLMQPVAVQMLTADIERAITRKGLR